MSLYSLPVFTSTATLILIKMMYAAIKQHAHRRSIRYPFNGTTIAVATSTSTRPNAETQSVGEKCKVTGMTCDEDSM
jgi:hypothetical protein